MPSSSLNVTTHSIPRSTLCGVIVSGEIGGSGSVLDVGGVAGGFGMLPANLPVLSLMYFGAMVAVSLV